MDIFEKLRTGEATVWINPDWMPMDKIDGICQMIVSDEDILDAEKRLHRFAPMIRRYFPETEKTGGLIESPLTAIPRMQEKIEKIYGCRVPGRLLLKMDSHLAIAGSVKARGGIYEVLKHAEDLAIRAGKLQLTDDYSILAEPEMKDFFSHYVVQVGSTGNLGLSIGIMSAVLGFQVKVHMSADAKQWKKDLLRQRGAQVEEYQDDYSAAVAEGRRQSDKNPMSYFVDDERSKDLFLGYAVAAGRLYHQLEQMNLLPNEKRPLLVYLPAGVGGAPGGVAYGLRRVFGDYVHCFFAEPVQCPSVLLGMASKKYEKTRVQDWGLTGITQADGLACPSPSGFVTRIMGNLLSGDFTVPDKRLFEYLYQLYQTEGIFIEPSACAGFEGAVKLMDYKETCDYCWNHGFTEECLKNSVQIVWATGGSLVPSKIREEYLSESER